MRKFIPVFSLCLSAVVLFSCSEHKLHRHPKWKKFFTSNGVKGCLMFHDYYNATFDVYGIQALQKRVLPGSSFKVMIALAGIETGVITDTNMVIKDSAVQKNVAGVTMAKAFRTGNTSYFQWVAKKIGKGRMQYWVDSTYYGNMRIGNNLTAFWLNDTLRISPSEQMGLVQQLYKEKLPFQGRTRELVTGLLLQKATYNDTLYYEQGIGHLGDKKTGWLSGWLQKRSNHYFFVIKTIASDTLSNLKKRDLNILYKVFNAKGMMSETGRFK